METGWRRAFRGLIMGIVVGMEMVLHSGGLENIYIQGIIIEYGGLHEV